jgi:DNA-directed RNA polymerase subunit RPC12/RpoP
MSWKCWWNGHDDYRARGNYVYRCVRCGRLSLPDPDLLGVTLWLVQGEREQDAKKTAAPGQKTWGLQPTRGRSDLNCNTQEGA